jgi:hypothetical protein
VAAIDSDQMSLSDTILINSLYELESWCTSIVAMQSNGTVIHARNLDFDFADYMRVITFRAVFVKDGKYVYDAVMFGGTVGIYTGMKKGVFSVSENQRELDKHKIGLLDNLYMQSIGYKEISWIIRDTLMTCDSYECA